MSLTFSLKSSKQKERITFAGSKIKGRDAKEKIAVVVGCTGRELELFVNGDKVGDDADIPSFSVAIVERVSVDARTLARAGRMEKRNRDQDTKYISTASLSAAMGVPGAEGSTAGGAAAATGNSEEDRLQALQQQVAGTTGATQFVVQGQRGGRRPEQQNQAPPTGYICRNCGHPGHYIQNCPEERGTVKRAAVPQPPVGIAESQLEVVGIDGDYEFVTRDGKYVRRKLDASVFGLASKKSSPVPEEAGAGDVAPSAVAPDVACAKCKRVAVDPVRTPCCDQRICETRCWEAYIEENGPTCPLCSDEPVMVDDAEPDKEARDKIKAMAAAK